MLSQLYLSRIVGEEQHDGEACEQTSILNGKDEEEAAATCILFLTTHLIHLWKLRSTKQRFFKTAVCSNHFKNLMKNLKHMLLHYAVIPAFYHTDIPKTSSAYSLSRDSPLIGS